MLTWKDVTEDPVLADLPYKIELAGSGEIVLSRRVSRHSLLRGRIVAELGRRMNGGEAMPSCPVDTSDNTKVVDVVWASELQIERFSESVSWPEAAEICVEVVSPADTLSELRSKIALYFERGAIECWICNGTGEMSFFTRDGAVPRSILCRISR